MIFETSGERRIRKVAHEAAEVESRRQVWLDLQAGDCTAGVELTRQLREEFGLEALVAAVFAAWLMFAPTSTSARQEVAIAEERPYLGRTWKADRDVAASVEAWHGELRARR